MKDESRAAARKTKAGAISAGWRPIAPPAGGRRQGGARAFSGPKLAGISGVHTGPGATALTRTPRGSSAAESERVNATIAPLVAL